MLVFKKGADTEGIAELPDTRLTVFTANLDKPPSLSSLYVKTVGFNLGQS